MKKLLILLMSFALLTACNNKKPNTDTKSTNTREKDDYSDNDNKDSKETNDKMDNKDNKDNNTNTDNKSNQNTEDNSSGWTRSDENRFMDDCEGTAAPKVGATRANEYCACMLAKLKRIYDSYNEADRKMANFSKAEIDDFAASCNR